MNCLGRIRFGKTRPVRSTRYSREALGQAKKIPAMKIIARPNFVLKTRCDRQRAG